MSLGRRLRSLRARVNRRIARRMVRSRRFTAWLRRYRPVQRVGGRIWITRYDDVVSVLERDREFAVPYATKMAELGVQFILGLDDSPQYERTRAALRRAIRPEDLPRLARAAAEHAEVVIAGLDGSVDVIAGLTDPVLGRTIGDYLGTGPAGSRGLAQARSVFEGVFLNDFNDPDVADRAAAGAAGMRWWLETVIADRHVAIRRGDRRDDVLGRALRMQAGPGPSLSDDELRDELLGLIAAWATSVSRTMGFAVDALLEQPRALASAQAAARGGDEAGVGAHMFEALRFQPQAPAVERRCARATVVRGRDVPRGAVVLPVIASAMMDGDRVDRPRSFRTDRSPAEQLHFGHGMHTCLGEAISRVQVAAVGTVLLGGAKIGRGSRLKWVGPYPRELRVTFEHEPAGGPARGR